MLLLRSAPPILLDLTRWTDRAEGDRLAADRNRLEGSLRTAAAAAR